MIIWTTLRCLEFQIDQHEERYNSDGVVSWELIKHMVRLAQRQAQDEAGKIIAAERETDQWRTRTDEANAKIRQLETELQAALGEAAHAGARWTDVVNQRMADAKRLREYEQATAQMNSALESARSDANLQAVRLAAAQHDRDATWVQNHTLAITLQCLRRFASAIQRAKHKYKHLDCQGANEEIEAALAQLQATDAMAAAQVAGVKLAWCGENGQPVPRPQPPTESPPAVTEPLDDSSGADGPGQS